MLRREMTAYLASYAASFNAPVISGVAVETLRRETSGRFRIDTTAGRLTAGQVVVATGPYQVPWVPQCAEMLPDDVQQIHSSEYRNAEVLAAGEVLVVGSGQSGAQIAEDLHLAGRKVHLAVGSSPRVARRYRGRDVVRWLADMGRYARTNEDFDTESRPPDNYYVTGRDGGRDIDLRALAREGMVLHGRLVTIAASDGRCCVLSFADDLAENLDGADAAADGIKDAIDDWINSHRIVARPEARYVPVWNPAPGATAVDAAAISAVVWATGFSRDDQWIDVPIFDQAGYPEQRRGVTSCPGLYFLGLPWQHTWGSGRLSGVGADAEYLADAISSAMRSDLSISRSDRAAAADRTARSAARPKPAMNTPGVQVRQGGGATQVIDHEK